MSERQRRFANEKKKKKIKKTFSCRGSQSDASNSGEQKIDSNDFRCTGKKGVEKKKNKLKDRKNDSKQKKSKAKKKKKIRKHTVAKRTERKKKRKKKKSQHDIKSLFGKAAKSKTYATGYWLTDGDIVYICNALLNIDNIELPISYNL